MEITASMVKELREKTGAGMMDCKKALQENNGEIEKSVEVKSDFKSKHTGNIVVEIEFNGKPSALMTTKADYWVWNDGFDFTWFKPQDIMKCLLLENIPQRQFVAKGDSKSKRAYLVKKEILYKYKIL